MHTSTHIPQVQQLFSPEWLYDSLMAQIEPDLMTKVISTLDAKYAGEKEEEKKERMHRYAQAFLLYDECLAELDWILTEDAKVLKDEMETFARKLERDERETDERQAASKLDSFNKDA